MLKQTLFKKQTIDSTILKQTIFQIIEINKDPEDII
jgi:hypothetical protein